MEPCRKRNQFYVPSFPHFNIALKKKKKKREREKEFIMGLWIFSKDVRDLLLNISRQYNVSDVKLRPDLFRDYTEIQSDSAFYNTVTEITNSWRQMFYQIRRLVSFAFNQPRLFLYRTEGKVNSGRWPYVLTRWPRQWGHQPDLHTKCLRRKAYFTAANYHTRVMTCSVRISSVYNRRALWLWAFTTWESVMVSHYPVHSV